MTVFTVLLCSWLARAGYYFYRSTEQRSVESTKECVRMSRTVKPPEIRKQELIDAAKKLFLENGYNATTVRDILREVNGAPGMFYYYFASKYDIYKEAMEQNLRTYTAEMTEILCNQSIPIPDRILRALHKFKFTFFAYSHGADRQMFQRDPDFVQRIKLIICEALTEASIKMLTDGIKSGDIHNKNLKQEDVPRIAPFIIFGFAGLINYDTNGEDDEDTEKKIQSHIDWFLNYVTPLFGYSLNFNSPAE